MIIFNSYVSLPLVKCLNPHFSWWNLVEVPIFFRTRPITESPRVSKVPETTTYILGSAGSWRFRWDDLLGVFFTWFAGISWGFLVDFLGFEMIFMGFYGILYGDSFLGGYSCEVFWGGILPGTVPPFLCTPLRRLRDVG